MKTLNDEAMKLLGDFWTIADCNAADYIQDTTTTTKKPLTLAALVGKILADPENIQWVSDEGYLDPNGSFEIWKMYLLSKIEKENAAIDRLNAIAEHSKDLIQELHRELASK